MKSQRAYQILVVLLLILPCTILSQQQMPLFAQKTPHILEANENFRQKQIHINSGNTSSFVINNALSEIGTFIPRFPTKTALVDPNLTIERLPFFCKKEFQFEKNTSVPLRVRLGSLDYVNKLEGKENHWSVAPRN